MEIEQKILKNTLTRRLLIILSILIVSCVHYITGNEFSFSIFYLIPIVIAAWYDTSKVIVMTLIVAVSAWLYVDFGTGRTYTTIIAPIWNTIVRFLFFAVVVILLLKIRANLVGMTKMAMKDTLTNLDNSRSFQRQYKVLQEQSKKNNKSYAMGVIDLDGFKKVNDTLGHSKGDDVLVEFAQILNKATRSSDVLARMGGDEFVLILKDTDVKGAEEYAKRLRGIFNLSGLKEKSGVDFSMGMRVFNNLPENLDDATHEADVLMYKAKELGKAQTTIRIA